MWGRKSKIKLAKTAAVKADKYAYRDRRNKKRAMRALWQLRINAAARTLGMNYSGLIDKMRKANVELDRKILSQLAKDHPKAFEAVVGAIKK
jgi:large subunit ribosomal protein L20